MGTTLTISTVAELLVVAYLLTCLFLMLFVLVCFRQYNGRSKKIHTELH